MTSTDPNGTADVYSYTYDENGIRSSKTVNGVTTYFTTKDGVILSQTDGTNTMYFQYDNSGNPTGFIYNGTQYFYLTNQMGDIIGITDNTGSLIATYTYGAWGEVLAVSRATTGNSTQLSIANANPLRYRGYYWDAETGYYYLQSRYYDADLIRFVNADQISVSVALKNRSIGWNTFSYCYNNPVNHEDCGGYLGKHWWNSVKWVGRFIDAAIIVLTTGYATGGKKVLSYLIRHQKSKLIRYTAKVVGKKLGLAASKWVAAAINIAMNFFGSSPGQIIAKALDWTDGWHGYKRSNGWIMN